MNVKWISGHQLTFSVIKERFELLDSEILHFEKNNPKIGSHLNRIILFLFTYFFPNLIGLQ